MRAAATAKCTCAKTERNAIASGVVKSTEPEAAEAATISILSFKTYTNQPSPPDIEYNQSEYRTRVRDLITPTATALAPIKSNRPASNLAMWNVNGIDKCATRATIPRKLHRGSKNSQDCGSDVNMSHINK